MKTILPHAEVNPRVTIGFGFDYAENNLVKLLPDPTFRFYGS